MQFVPRTVILVSLVLAAGCAAASETPATTPSSVATVTTAAPGIVVSTTTTALATTTTIDRLSEIAAIFEDLEKRRLQAIFDQDEASFRAVHANDTYEELSIGVMELVRVIDPNAVTVEIHEVLFEDDDCVAVQASIDLSSATERGEMGVDLHVIERTGLGWGFSWTGEGWQCVGPHPLS